VNASTVKEVTAGFWGPFLLKLGVLLILSGLTWTVGQIFVEMVFRTLPSIEPPYM